MTDPDRPSGVPEATSIAIGHAFQHRAAQVEGARSCYEAIAFSLNEDAEADPGLTEALSIIEGLFPEITKLPIVG